MLLLLRPTAPTTPHTHTGHWVSPISSELIVSKTLGLGSPSLLLDGTITWAELRPSEGGRNVIAARWVDQRQQGRCCVSA